MPAPAPSDVHSTPLPPAAKRPAGSRWAWAFLIDIAVFLFVCAVAFGVYAIGQTWLGPVHPEAHISQNPRDLPLYAFYSLVRIGIAYALSLAFALAYGYLAASSRRAAACMLAGDASPTRASRIAARKEAQASRHRGSACVIEESSRAARRNAAA